MLALVDKGQALYPSVPCPERDQIFFLACAPSYPSLAKARKWESLALSLEWPSSLLFWEPFCSVRPLGGMVSTPWSVCLAFLTRDLVFRTELARKLSWVVCHHLSLIFTRHVQYEPQTQKTINHVLCHGESDFTWKSISSPGKCGYNEICLGGLH